MAKRKKIPIVAGEITLTVSGTTITLAGKPATGGTTPRTYQWQRSKRKGVGFVDVKGATSLHFNDTGLLPNKRYYYRLIITDCEGETAVSDEITVMTTMDAPPAGVFGFMMMM